MGAVTALAFVAGLIWVMLAVSQWVSDIVEWWLDN